ncbi:MAG TPA: AraC family transcriptional regulator, partial [Polyangiales bacterium]|nr:AraC family transcriptional regulator [Polyangiales bacterium]
LRLTGNSGLGLDLGLRVGPSNLGMLGLAAMSSPNARGAIELAIRYYRLIAPFWDLSLDVADGRAEFVVREAIPLQAMHVFASEIVIVSSVGISRALLGEEAPLLALELDYAKPPHARRYSEEITAAPIRFGQPVTRIVFDADVLERKLPSFDPATMRAAERQCEANLATSGITESLVTRVRRLLEASPGQYPSLSELAKALQTSERTLRRDLVEMGTSYQALVGIARSKHATELLTTTNKSINEIAEELGFSEGRALRRAFKRWTGRTAARYRQDARAERGR